MFLGTAALILYLDHLQKNKQTGLPECDIVFVLGGPGAGKVRIFGKLSNKNIVKEWNFHQVLSNGVAREPNASCYRIVLMGGFI